MSENNINSIDNAQKSIEEKKQEVVQAYMDYFKKRMDFSSFSKTIVQDLVNNRKESVLFKRYTKEQIVDALEKPQSNEKIIRQMSIFLYDNSSHYRRLCNYFSKLSTLNHLLKPYNLNPEKYNKKQFLLNYRKVTNILDKFNFKYNLLRILNVCMYQDQFCGLYFETEESFDIVQLNNDFCKISSKEDGCLVYSLDFNFFNNRKYLLESYGEEIKQMYLNYVGYEIEKTDKKGKKTISKVSGNPDLRWQEPLNQICFKVNEDQLLYALPPFAGIFPEILNLEDYKLLKKSGEILDRYKVLVMQIPVGDDGELQFSEELATKYYNQACANVDTGVGIILSPMKIDMLDFNKKSTSDSDAVSEAESALWAASGSNKLLFGGGDKSSSSSIDLSIRNDESITFAILKQCEIWFNRYIKKLNLPYDFKLHFLNQSIYNEDDVCDRYQKAATFGVSGSRSLYAASLGLTPSDVLCMQELEDSLDFIDKWIPMKSSNTMNTGDEGGRSKQKTVDDAGEQTREDDENDNR